MMFYNKINDLQLSDNIDVLSLKDNLKFSFSDKILNYYSVKDESCFSNIIERIPPNYEISFLEIVNDVGPHVDSGVISCINFYIKSGFFQTDFWHPKPKINSVNTVKTVNGVNTKESIGFYLNDLKLANRFIAYDNDVYTLDISKIHSVYRYKLQPGKRIIIQFSWKDVSHAELNNFLKETSNEKSD